MRITKLAGSIQESARSTADTYSPKSDCQSILTGDFWVSGKDTFTSKNQATHYKTIT